MEQARALAGDTELQTLRAQVMALAEAEAAARAHLEQLRVQVTQLGQREAAARAQLKEAQSLTRAMQERARLEATEAQAGLRQNLDDERNARAKAEAELKKAVSDLQQQRSRPDAELATLRELFTDLMREEAKSRQRLQRLQQQAEDQEKRARDLQEQLEQIRAQGPAGQVEPAELTDLQKRVEGLLTELAEERGRAKAHADRAAAEIEWAQERAREASQAEARLSGELFEAKNQLSEARDALASERDRRERAVSQLGGEVGALRSELDQERLGAGAELADLRQKLQAALEENRHFAQKVKEQSELRALFRDELKDERLAAHTNAVRVTELERQLREVGEKLQRAEKIVGETGDAPALREALKERDAELEKTRADLTGLRADFARVQTELFRLQSELADARGALQRSEHERSQEAMRRQAAEDERDRAAHLEQAAKSEARLQRTRAEAEIAAQAEELKRSRAAQESARREQERLRDELAAKLSEQKRLETQLAALVRAGGDQEELSRSMARAVAEAEQLKAGLGQAEQKREQAARDLDTARAELAASRTEAVDLSMRLDAAEKWARDLEPLAASLTPRRAASLAIDENRLDDASRLLQGEAPRSQDDAEFHLLVGRLQARRGKDAAAEASLQRAAELDTKSVRAPLELAMLQSRRGLRRQARASFNEVLRRKPDCFEARDGLRLLDAAWMWRGAIAVAALGVVLLLLLLRRM